MHELCAPVLRCLLPADPLVETASLASIPLPKPAFRPTALDSCVKEHLLSDAQVGRKAQRWVACVPSVVGQCG